MEDPQTGAAALCEETKFGLTHVPGIVYYDAKGNQAGTTEQFESQDQLKQRIEDLLKG